MVSVQYLQLNHHRHAEKHLRLALADQPSHLMARLALAKLQVMSGRDLPSQDYFGEDAVSNIGSGIEQYALAKYFVELGEFERAGHVLCTLIKSEDDRAKALNEMSALPVEYWVKNLDRQISHFLERPELDARTKARLQFASGRVADAENRFDQAFEWFAAGNAAAESDFDIKNYEATCEALIEMFPRWPGIAESLPADPEFVPIFIVGLPRAGKTSLEKWLLRHPAITGGGEIALRFFVEGDLFVGVDGLLSEKFAASVAALSPRNSARLSQPYMTEFAPWLRPADGTRFLTNTMPSNFQNIGVILKLFPFAKIIHVRRDPLDTAIFCYMKKFKNKHFYTNDLVDFGHYYQYYQKLVRHWKSILAASSLKFHLRILSWNPIGWEIQF